MIPEAEVLKTFQKVTALQTGHFALSSGNHSDTYLQCALVTQYPEAAALLAAALAEHFLAKDITVVLGPAIGGIVIAQEVARALFLKDAKPERYSNVDVFDRPQREFHQKDLAHTIRAVFCERVDGKMALRRGFTLSAQDKVLAVEDVITTGGSVKEAVELARSSGAQVVGVGSFIDRSTGPLDLGAPLSSLLKIKAAIYPPDACPLCKQGLPVNKPGSRGLK
jgi:orotate phosphoribosyltransferase